MLCSTYGSPIRSRTSLICTSHVIKRNVYVLPQAPANLVFAACHEGFIGSTSSPELLLQANAVNTRVQAVCITRRGAQIRTKAARLPVDVYM